MNTALISHPAARLAVLATVVAAAMALPVSAAQPGSAPVVALAGQQVYAIVSGGIGDEERDKIESQVGAYSMRLVLSARNGHYIVADDVSVRRGGAEVLHINDAGPLVYAQIPPGQYTVTAVYKGVTQTRTVTVGSRPGDVHLTWPTELD